MTLTDLLHGLEHSIESTEDPTPERSIAELRQCIAEVCRTVDLNPLRATSNDLFLAVSDLKADYLRRNEQVATLLHPQAARVKRYWLFGFKTYYPQGGLRDLLGGYTTAEEAALVGSRALDDESVEMVDTYQVIDSLTGNIVATGSIELRLGPDPINSVSQRLTGEPNA